MIVFVQKGCLLWGGEDCNAGSTQRDQGFDAKKLEFNASEWESKVDTPPRCVRGTNGLSLELRKKRLRSLSVLVRCAVDVVVTVATKWKAEIFCINRSQEKDILLNFLLLLPQNRLRNH